MDIEKEFFDGYENQRERDVIIKGNLQKINFLGINGQTITFKFKIDSNSRPHTLIQCEDTVLIHMGYNDYKVYSDDPSEFVPSELLLRDWRNLDENAHKKKTKMKIGREYIIKRLTSSYSQPMRVKVLDITETSIRFDNLDGNIRFREELNHFEDNFKVLEQIRTFDIDKICHRNEG